MVTPCHVLLSVSVASCRPLPSSTASKLPLPGIVLAGKGNVTERRVVRLLVADSARVTVPTGRRRPSQSLVARAGAPVTSRTVTWLTMLW